VYVAPLSRRVSAERSAQKAAPGQGGFLLRPRLDGFRSQGDRRGDQLALARKNLLEVAPQILPATGELQERVVNH
jgi:hypothetical protein